MATVKDDLDWVQARLHDSGVIWTRTELLRWYNDGYRDILAKSKAFVRILPLDIPGRFTYSLTYDWEDRHATGTFWIAFLASFDASYRCSYLWEAEQLEGVTPTNSLVGITQQWERAYTTDTDRHFRFGLRKEHERIKRIYWDDALLLPISVRELDENDRIWTRTVGEPAWWTPGTGRSREFEIYEIKTDYNQGYSLVDFEAGLPRRFSGSRTYATSVGDHYPENSYAYATSGDSDALTQATTALISGLGWRFTQAASDSANSFCTQSWEKQLLEGETQTDGKTIGTYAWEFEFGSPVITFAVGALRSITSPDRQYLPIITGTGPYALLGAARDFRSTENALTVFEVVIPDKDLTESDRPEMIPAQVQKYLKYYTLYRAYGRIGEGQNLDLATHYKQRYQRGIALLQRLADVAHQDRVYSKEPVAEFDTKPARVKLPSHFERVW